MRKAAGEAMRLGRVIGRVWSTAKSSQFDGRKLLLIQPIDAEGGDFGEPLVAVDAIGAGSGETIYWCRGKEASFAFGPGEMGAGEVGTDAAVIAIVDKARGTERAV